MDFLDNVSPEWLEEQFRLWQDNPQSFDPVWRAFFTGFALQGSGAPRTGLDPDSAACQACCDKQTGVTALINRYREVGHLLACTDPMHPCPVSHPLLDLVAFGLDDGDLETVFVNLDFHLKKATLRQMVESLRQTYCRSIGVEYQHIQEPAERLWLRERMEPTENRTPVDREGQLDLLRTLTDAALFEEFLHRRFIGQKRFSLEGGEALIVFLEQLVQRTPACGVAELEIGMPHRGRLNVLANILGKPLATIFAEFADNLEFGFVGEGDVKYHKGYDSDRQFADGSKLHLTLAFNPSHLEAVNPVVEGKCRARQDLRGEGGKKAVLPVLIHGDAAFSGQGMVAEILNLSQLEGYGTGGTIHIVLNNQIGFTTLPADARSTRYATDVAKMLMAPVFHVHGEDPEAAAHVAALALDYRQRYGRDVIVEIICYRRHGHNEGDEPAFTQPQMYDWIKDHPPVHRIYAERLEADGLDPAVPQRLEAEMNRRLQAAFEAPAEPVGLGFRSAWEGMQRGYAPVSVDTGVLRERLVSLCRELTTLPEGFAPHPKIAALIAKRRQAVEEGSGIDWGNAEALAFATLLTEGIPVRVSGQDSRRGTFNHRHSVLHDIHREATHTPLATLGESAARFSVYDSLLSENAVLGFEYGYAVSSPKPLVIWEAQFGDFANGAQVIIDQFIAGGETKWDRSCGLVMLLPHGYEGQGSEHSSARIERYLQLCAEENLLVANPTTPGQLFHLFRRQVHLPFRKPLIVFTPKSLLRHPVCISDLEELTTGSFREIIHEDAAGREIGTVLLCSGKVYYDLREEREKTGRNDVTIIRVEQLYPLRSDLLREAVVPHAGVTDWRWVQEEPANMGAWSHLQRSLEEIIGKPIAYVGRPAAAAPATGSHRQHAVEQAALVTAAFAR